MFERFTERARQVVVLAQQDARALGHDYIGTEHLLLGLLRVEDGLAARVLASFGIDYAWAREQVVLVVGEGTEHRAAGQIPFSPRAKKVLELALREALSLGHNYIGTEHILLGLVRENEGAAARILLEREVGAELVRDKIFELLGSTATEARRRRLPGLGRRVASHVLAATGAEWEYRIEHAPELDETTQDWLNTLGADGWELTATWPDGRHFVFKRRCQARRSASA